MLSAASTSTVQLSQDGINQQSSYQSRQESVPLFIVELDGQLKAFWNSSKLLMAPLTLKKICQSPCHLILTYQQVLDKTVAAYCLKGYCIHLISLQSRQLKPKMVK